MDILRENGTAIFFLLVQFKNIEIRIS
jgi:hypothetical protein